MRVNVYAEEMTDRVEIISKEIEGQTFTGLRFYLELPVTVPVLGMDTNVRWRTINSSMRGPFIHHKGDDDSAAVTFWGKRDLRDVLKRALDMLDKHYAGTAKKRGYSSRKFGYYWVTLKDAPSVTHKTIAYWDEQERRWQHGDLFHSEEMFQDFGPVKPYEEPGKEGA